MQTCSNRDQRTLLCLKAQCGLKLLNYFTFIDDNVFSKARWVIITRNHWQVCQFRLEVLCVIQVICIYLVNHLKPARFKLLRTDFITDYYCVHVWDVTKIKCLVHMISLNAILFAKLCISQISGEYGTVRRSILLQRDLNEYNSILQIWKKGKFIYFTCLKPTM